MSLKSLDILCSPLDRAVLELATEPALNGNATQFLVNQDTGARFPIREGIPIFVEPDQITGVNRRFRDIYDTWAPFYDLLSRVGLYILGVSETKLRQDFVESLEIKPGDRVLATSVGTGSDLPFLPRSCDFHGLDLSSGMLAICQKKMRRSGRSAKLFLGQAEHLPFRDETFDMVYQMGGFNFFSDQRQAVHEMIRVARPGSRIVLMDETEKVARRLEYLPGIGAWFRHPHRPIVAPDALVPVEMEQIESHELCDGQAWYVSFRKPR